MLETIFTSYSALVRAWVLCLSGMPSELLGGTYAGWDDWTSQMTSGVAGGIATIQKSWLGIMVRGVAPIWTGAGAMEQYHAELLPALAFVQAQNYGPAESDAAEPPGLAPEISMAMRMMEPVGALAGTAWLTSTSTSGVQNPNIRVRSSSVVRGTSMASTMTGGTPGHVTGTEWRQVVQVRAIRWFDVGTDLYAAPGDTGLISSTLARIGLAPSLWLWADEAATRLDVFARRTTRVQAPGRSIQVTSPGGAVHTLPPSDDSPETSAYRMARAIENIAARRTTAQITGDTTYSADAIYRSNRKGRIA